VAGKVGSGWWLSLSLSFSGSDEAREVISRKLKTKIGKAQEQIYSQASSHNRAAHTHTHTHTYTYATHTPIA